MPIFTRFLFLFKAETFHFLTNRVSFRTYTPLQRAQLHDKNPTVSVEGVERESSVVQARRRAFPLCHQQEWVDLSIRPLALGRCALVKQERIGIENAFVQVCGKVRCRSVSRNAACVRSRAFFDVLDQNAQLLGELELLPRQANKAL